MKGEMKFMNRDFFSLLKGRGYYVNKMNPDVAHTSFLKKKK